MGMAVARRLGSGRTLFLADVSHRRLDEAVGALQAEGYTAQGLVTDVSDRESVDELAKAAAGEGDWPPSSTLPGARRRRPR
jgi:NADP-dependent 3-hydroxy acid dehydrogenase YdfG